MATRFDGATENAAFTAKVQQNFGLDFVTEQHTNHCKKISTSLYSLV